MEPSPIEAHTPILIADDDVVVRSLMRDVLEIEGYKVTEAGDGVAALQMCSESPPSLMVVDVEMPRMGGFALCEALRANPATAHVPILMATGHDDSASIDRAFSVGATDFISKPLNWLLLKHRLRYMLRGSRILDELRASEARLAIAEQTQREQARQFETALDNMSQGLCMFGPQGQLLVSNRRFREIYRLGPEDVQKGAVLSDVLVHSPLFGAESDQQGGRSPLQTIELLSLREAAVQNQKLPDGRHVIITHEPMAGGGSVDTFTDVTRQQEVEAKITHMATHDALTDLSNRMLFRQRLADALCLVDRGVPCSVHVLDLDRFSAINDGLGHHVGDALLQVVAERLRRLVRQTDTIARLGGDEFGVIQSSANQPGDAKTLAERFVRELGRPYYVEGHHLQIGASIGITLAPFDGTDPDQLLKQADLALYRAKGEGGARFAFFEREMDAKMQARRLLEIELRAATVTRDFALHFQPLINLECARITGFEALIRWNNPHRGMVSPAEFIPLAEEIGLIGELGAWVVRTACQEARSWPDDLKVSVNVSVAQFRKHHNLFDVVADALKESGLPARRLDIEVTESLMADDFGSALVLLRRVKDLGVSISMDDFGTGYSSLSFLRSFPFDKIKIDRSFVEEMGTKRDSTAIIRAVTGLCRSIEMTSTAEGVETGRQVNMLRREGCTEIQGYFISKPRPAKEIPAFLEHFRTRGAAELRKLMEMDEV